MMPSFILCFMAAVLQGVALLAFLKSIDDWTPANSVAVTLFVVSGVFMLISGVAKEDDSE